MALPPLISVIIPNRNYSAYLPECLESILNQTLQDFEIIVSDDASVDESVRVASRYPKTTVLKSSIQTGPGAARNRALSASRGVYIAFLDSDDYLPPNSLELRLLTLQQSPAVDLVCGATQVMGGDIITRPFQTSSVLLRRTILEQFGMFDEAFRHGEDKELWVRIFGPGPAYPRTDRATFRFIPSVVSYYRKHDDSHMGRFRAFNRNAKIAHRAARKAAYLAHRDGIDTSRVQLLLPLKCQ